MGTPTIRIRQLLLLLLFYDAGRLSDAAESGGRKNKVLQVDKASEVHKSSNDTISTVESLFSPSQSWSITTSTSKFNSEQVTTNQRSATPILHALLHPISSPEYRPLHRQPLPMHGNNESFTTVIKKTPTLETSALFKPSIQSEIRHFLSSRSADGAFEPQNLSVSDQLSASINASPFLANRSTPVQRIQTLLADSSLIEKRDSSTQDQNNVFPKSHIVNIPDVPHNATFSDLNGSSLEDNNASVHTLYIGGLFELSSRDGPNGYSELDAALLAISHINDQNIIPGYKLNLLYNDSRCDAGYGTDAFFDLINRKSKKSSLVMMMGSACSEVTKTIAEIVPYWNLILVSYAETSPALREREKYRTFFSLAIGDSALNPARRMLVKYFKWDKVAALYEDHETLSLAFNDINKDFSAHDIIIKSSTSFKDVKVEVPGKLKEMMDLDVRILLAGFRESTARQVFCQAYRLGMYGPRYVWILVGLLKSYWWTEVLDTACTVQEIGTAVEGAFIIFSLNGLLDGGKSVANLTSSEFRDAYINANGSLPMSIFAASTYDTIWTMALTLRQATSEWSENGTAPLLHQLSYDVMADVKETFITTMENLEFPGVSGPVSFKGSGREGITAVYQIQAGNFTQVAIHQPGSNYLDFTCESCRKIYWKDDRVPKDEQTVVARPKTIDMFVFYTSSGLCVVGVVMAVCFLTYNLYHRKLKYIKLSSPILNNVAVIGCILVYLAVIIMGLDDRMLNEELFPIVCTVRAFLLAAGFSLAFGAMFAKTFRVHQIFIRAHHGLVKSKLIQDTHLLVIIGVLLAVDSTLVLVWVLVDPMSRLVSNTTTEVSEEDEDLIFQEQLTTCHSSHLQKWLGAFYAYKGLLLIFGVYMAWETRRVKIPALNDSKYIGLNVYNVVIMSVSVVVISNILSSQPTLAYAMESSFMFLSTTVTLCLLFVPKIYALVTSGGNPVIACTGILVDNSNTRRFVFDDRKEIYYRAEVQNRVYKRELVELDQKIARLERLLELPSEHYPSVMSEMMYRMQDSSADRNRRYTREWDRCSSISDGEGMTYDYTEKQDILTEMGFVSVTKPAAVTKKRSKAGELGRRGSSTLQKLTRSWSIGAGSRVRKKRQSLETPRSFVPFSSSESNFVHNSDFEVLDGRAGTNYPKGNACSNALSYIYSADATENCGLENSLMPKSHNATQTFNSKNVFLKRGSSLKYNANHKESSFVGDDLDGRGRRMDYRWQGRLLNSKQAKLFAVHQLHIEMVEEDSNSNVEDTESLAGSSAGCVSPCYDVSIPVLGSEARHLKLMPSSESSCREAITWQNACPLTTFSSSIGQSDTNHLLPCEHRKMGMENLRRLSAPSPLQHKPDLPLANNFTLSTSATTTAVPKNSSSLCLVSDFKKEKQDLSNSDICLNCRNLQAASAETSPYHSSEGNSSPPLSKASCSDSKELSSFSDLEDSIHSQYCNESYAPSSAPTTMPPVDITNQSHNIAAQIEIHPKVTSAKNAVCLPCTSGYFISSVSSSERPEVASGDPTIPHQDSRRLRIQQLQEDLVKIQKELHELTNNDCETYEL